MDWVSVILIQMSKLTFRYREREFSTVVLPSTEKVRGSEFNISRETYSCTKLIDQRGSG